MNTHIVRVLAGAWILSLALVSISQAAPCALPELRWMAVSWHNAKDPARAWEFPPGRSGYAEIMTVKQDGDAITMLLRHFDGGLTRAWEERDAPMVFKASVCEKSSVVFDGHGDHEGEHLTYKRSGAHLLIIGDFLHKGVPDHEEWQMIKASE
jgi:hypothetical protein